MLNVKRIIFYIAATIILVLGGIYLNNCFFILFAVIYPIILWIGFRRQNKKVFMSNKALKNAEAVFEFYDTYFVESKTNFYLMTAKNQGYILIKAEFPKGLEELLHNLRIK